MRVYHDWEFLEEGNSIYPISVGMVAEDGSELYYEFINAPWGKVFAHDWLPENVLPALKGGQTAYITGEGNAIVKSTMAIRIKVFDFLKAASQDSRLELWGWYSAYDHVCLAQLFGRMVDLPGFVPMYTKDIKQEADRIGGRIPDMRKPGEIVHNALDDARAEQRMHQWLIRYEKGGKLRERKPLRPSSGWRNPGTPWYRDPLSMEH
jgi:hypothetical protein